jgi:hypothetical protein
MLTKPCHDCPHLKQNEGGVVPTFQGMLSGGVPHPCHNAARQECFGHKRDIEGIAAGTLVDNGDIVKAHYELKNEFTGEVLYKGTVSTVQEVLDIRKRFGATS